MSEAGRRTAEEREAARRERERRRAEREGDSSGPATADGGYDFETGEHEFEGGASHPEARAGDAEAPDPIPEARAGDAEAPDPIPDARAGDAESPDPIPDAPAGDTGVPDPEAPAGTRRVSRAENLAARSARRAPRPPRTPRRRGPAGQHRRASWRGRTGSLVALLLAAGLIWFLVELFQPFHGSGHGKLTVVIPARSSSSQIGDLLARKGVISSSFFFELRATLAGERGDLRSGTYHLALGMSYGDVLAALTKAPPAAKVSELTITEGRTRQYVNARLRAEHLGGGYLALTRHSPLIDPRAYGLRHAPPSLEGFLFPDTYQLLDPIKISALVRDQLIAFKENFAKVDQSYARRKHLTPYDVLTIASLIEAEAASARDRPLVASVVYNRLAAGMMLQFDSTTRYATGNYTRPLTVSELHSRSRWNTHTHFGLPPTPIDSPGLAAIEAAAHPAHTNYLFFFARRCGRGTAFASTYSQFLSQASQDQQRRC